MDCVILGYTTEKRNISALLIGAYKDGKLIPLGKVGTGFSDKTLQELEKAFRGIKRASHETKEKVQWLKPVLVCEVKYHEITRDKSLRAPVFLRLREDKNPEDCILSG